MFIRIISILIPILSGLGYTPHREPTATRQGVDVAVVSRAAVQLGRKSPLHVLNWLRSQPGVAAARLGRDGRTIDIAFGDGMRSAILPAPRDRIQIARGMRRAHRHLQRLRAKSGRGLVLEPFATQLYLGPTAGEREAAALQAAGYAVDQAHDSEVTLATMTSISQYNVVYMLTHSGVNAQGEGVIATGQVATGDPTVQALLDDRTVMVVGVAGSSTRYYGVLSGYFRLHMGNFTSDALIFVNGCSVLRATRVWNAMSVRGAATLVSWDNEAMQNDDVLAGSSFFDAMARGATVSDALASVYALGHGRSTVDGNSARLGYRGDGGITLQRILLPLTPTPSVLPTTSPTLTPSPTLTVQNTRVPTRAPGDPWPQPRLLATVLHGTTTP